MPHRPGPLTLLCLAWALPALAGQPVRQPPLGDPTRPPGSAATPAAPRSGLAGPARPAAAPAPAAGPAAPLPLPLLQAVQLPAHGPAVAMIDGQPVLAGDSVAGRRVLSIDPQGLLLRGSAGDERLWLLVGSPKQAPGSILVTRSARFVPAPAAADPPADIETPPRTELASRGLRASAAPAAPANPGPLSLAGKNAP